MGSNGGQGMGSRGSGFGEMFSPGNSMGGYPTMGGQTAPFQPPPQLQEMLGRATGQSSQLFRQPLEMTPQMTGGQAASFQQPQQGGFDPRQETNAANEWNNQRKQAAMPGGMIGPQPLPHDFQPTDQGIGQDQQHALFKGLPPTMTEGPGFLPPARNPRRLPSDIVPRGGQRGLPFDRGSRADLGNSSFANATGQGSPYSLRVLQTLLSRRA